MKPDWVRAMVLTAIAVLLVCFWTWVIGSAIHVIQEHRARVAYTEVLEKHIAEGETMYAYEHRLFTEDQIEARHRRMAGEFYDN